MRPAWILRLALLLALGLTIQLVVLEAPPARAQSPNVSTITVTTWQTEVYEGGLAVFNVSRAGGPVSRMTVRVKTWEPDWDTPSPNITEQTHDVTFVRGSRVATLRVAAYNDDQADAANTTLNAQVLAASDGAYEVGSPDMSTIEVIDFGNSPPLPVVSIVPDQSSVTEGGTADFQLTRTGGLTTQALTVDIRVEDPAAVLLGNHWEPPPQVPTQVVIPAGSTSHEVSLSVPDDLREIPDADLKMVVLPSFDYLLGVGIDVSASIAVSDNDVAQELELKFGKEGVDEADVSEGDKLAFVVKRRQADADTGNTAYFTVRVETDRSGADHVLADWTEDTDTGRLFRDYPLQLTGSVLEVREEIRVSDDGEAETDWHYWASIRPIVDHDGADLTPAEEASYWTVESGFREKTIDATDSGASNGTVTIEADVATVVEGREVLYSVHRLEGPHSQSVNVEVRTSEINRATGHGVNPST